MHKLLPSCLLIPLVGSALAAVAAAAEPEVCIHREAGRCLDQAELATVKTSRTDFARIAYVRRLTGIGATPATLVLYHPYPGLTPPQDYLLASVRDAASEEAALDAIRERLAAVGITTARTTFEGTWRSNNSALPIYGADIQMTPTLIGWSGRAYENGVVTVHTGCVDRSVEPVVRRPFTCRTDYGGHIGTAPEGHAVPQLIFWNPMSCTEDTTPRPEHSGYNMPSCDLATVAKTVQFFLDKYTFSGDGTHLSYDFGELYSLGL